MTRPAWLTSLTTAARERLAGRLALGVGRRDLERERLAVEVDVAAGLEADVEAADRQHHGRRGRRRCPAAAGRPVASACSSANPSVGEARRGTCPSASVVPWRTRPSGRVTSIGRSATGAPYWYLATTSASIVSPAVEDRLLQVEAQVDRLELVRLDLERAGEVALARLVDADAVGADRGAAVERQRLVEGAEVRERHAAGRRSAGRGCR